MVKRGLSNIPSPWPSYAFEGIRVMNIDGKIVVLGIIGMLIYFARVKSRRRIF